MKKIVKSFLAIGLTSLAVYGSIAYFSDTETSTGNVFQAGAIDLTIDSEAHYNGLVCKGGEWTNSCTPGEELITNGGFEADEVIDGANWQLFGNPTGWSVAWEAGQPTTFNSENQPATAFLEYHEVGIGWNPFDGDQYVELDTDWDGPSGSLSGEPALVKIYQDIVTTPGTKYELTYHYSPRPGVSDTNNQLIVRVEGSQVATHSQAGGGNTNWTQYSYEFTATDASTRIEFAAGGSPDSLGVFLDGVSLHGLNCESVFTELEGKACHNSWELTDLGPEHHFWWYEDIKPGDEGENTISLHVTSNEAYACLLAHNFSDNDLNLTEPEAEDPDENDLIGPNEGEMAENMNVFMWHDDGDNVWEEGETPITPSAVPANEAFNNASYDIATPATGPIQPGDVDYIGIAWCAGTLTVDGDNFTLTCDGATMGNEAQTDQLKVDLTFYVEQARNNPDFSCANVPLPSPTPSPTTTPIPTILPQ